MKHIYRFFFTIKNRDELSNLKSVIFSVPTNYLGSNKEIEILRKRVFKKFQRDFTCDSLEQIIYSGNEKISEKVDPKELGRILTIKSSEWI